MSVHLDNLPDDFPGYLRHSDEDTPVPTWQEATRSTRSRDEDMIAHFSRILTGGDDSRAAEQVWESWPGNYRRSVTLLVDKIYNEGWLDSVGLIKGWPWDGGFFFHAVETDRETLEDILDSKSGEGGVYTQCSLSNGLFAYLNAWNHKGWERGWMENNAGMAALHIGLFEDRVVEVHMEAFNPLHTNEAPEEEVVTIPLLGSYNHRLFLLHRRWEQSEYSSIVRTSANFYHMMKGRVPMSF
jgi:hypothetical protein